MLSAMTARTTPSLDARPKATALTVEDLVRDALKGRIRVPPFQRELQWTRDDARKLFDSIYRGYPIGTLLFWQTSAETERLTFGPVLVEAEMKSDAWWVVDGQQRIHSLVRVLNAAAPDRFALAFDLDEEEFIFASRAKDEERYIPMTEVLDSERVLRWVSARRLTAARRGVGFRLNKRVREYSIPAYVVETGDAEVLRHIFRRSNESGKPLTAADVFDAIHGARGTKEPTDFKAVARSLETLGFGVPDGKVIYRALRAIQGLDPARAEVPEMKNAAKAYNRTDRALRAATVFLMTRAGIPRLELLPYTTPLLALAKFFDRHAEAAPRSLELLSRWLWRGAVTGLHSGDTVAMRDSLAAIDADEDASVQRLLETVTGHSDAGVRPLEALQELSTYDFRHARTKLEILALLSLGPRHLQTGETIVASSFDGPDAIAKLANVSDPAGATIANRLLHPKIPHLRSVLAHAAQVEVRRSHAVGKNAHYALAKGDDLGFLRARAAEILEVVGRFISARAKWDQSDRPPLRTLRVEDA